MKNMNRISDNELAMVNGGAPVVNGYGIANGMKKRVGAANAAGNEVGSKKQMRFGWHWGDDWGDEGYWH